MEKLNEFAKILKEIKLCQVINIGKFNGYDNMPDEYKKEFVEQNEKLIAMMKEL